MRSNTYNSKFHVNDEQGQRAVPPQAKTSGSRVPISPSRIWDEPIWLVGSRRVPGLRKAHLFFFF